MHRNAWNYLHECTQMINKSKMNCSLDACFRFGLGLLENAVYYELPKTITLAHSISSIPDQSPSLHHKHNTTSASLDHSTDWDYVRKARH